ncbi:MAG: Clp1/GlmU family protein, partial [Candidatus Rifleibacteriota bacterium]
LHFAPALCGVVEMLRKAEKEADALIIDTTGWVQGDGGRAIKKAKLDIVDPDMVVLMQRSNELEHLVRHLPSEKVVRLPVSKKASSTSQMDRKALRELVSKRYFKDAKVFEIPFKQLYTDRCYFRTGTKIELEGTLHAERLSGWEGTLVVTSGPLMPELTKNWPKDLGMVRNFIAGGEKGLMIALLDENQNMLAIGRLEEFDFLNDNFRIRSNYRGDLGRIKGIQFGSLRLNEAGEEAGFIEPGAF